MIMTHNIYVYILLSGLVSYMIRVLPLTLIRRPITNTWFRSFLYYVPYATLAVMTFPAILYAAESPWAGLAALIAGGVLGLKGRSLPEVAAVCCVTVFLLELILVHS